MDLPKNEKSRDGLSMDRFYTSLILCPPQVTDVSPYEQ